MGSFDSSFLKPKKDGGKGPKLSGEQVATATSKNGTKLILTPPFGFYDGINARVTKDPAYIVGDVIPMTALSNNYSLVYQELLIATSSPIYLWSYDETWGGGYNASREFLYLTSDKIITVFNPSGTVLRSYDYSSNITGTITACQFNSYYKKSFFIATQEGTTNRLYVVRTDLQRATLLYTATSQPVAWTGIGVQAINTTSCYVFAGLQKAYFTYSQGASINLPFLYLSVVEHATDHVSVAGTTIRYGSQFFHSDQTTYPDTLIGVVVQEGMAAFGQKWSSGVGQYYYSHRNIKYDGTLAPSVGTGGGSISFFGSSSYFWTSVLSSQLYFWYTAYVDRLTTNCYGYRVNGLDHSFLDYSKISLMGSVLSEFQNNRTELLARANISGALRTNVIFQDSGYGDSSYQFDFPFIEVSHTTPNVNCWSANSYIANVNDQYNKSQFITYSIYAVGNRIYKATSYGKKLI